MIKPIALTLDGFRGYKTAERFDLTRPLIILGPNAHGKSSISDAVEFLLSEKATIERFGERDNEKMVGRRPLLHVLRDDGSVSLEFRVDGKDITFTRPVDGGQKVAPRPSELQPVVDSIAVPIVLRGYDLRRFAEGLTPQQRYTELTGWLGAAKLLDVQNALHKLKRDFKATCDALSDPAEQRRILQKALVLKRSFSDKDIFDCLNSLFASSALPSISDPQIRESDPVVADLLSRARQLEGNLLVAQLQKARDLLVLENEEGVSDLKRLLGFDESIREARQKLASEGDVALLLAAIDAGQQYLATNSTDICPICETPWTATRFGSQQGAVAGLDDQIAALKAQRDLLLSIHELETARSGVFESVKQKLLQVRGAIGEITTLPPERSLTSLDEITSAESFAAFDQDVLTPLRLAVSRGLDEKNQETVTRILRTFLTVYQTRREMERKELLRRRAIAIEGELDDAIQIANESIKAFLQAAVDDLSSELCKFYEIAQEGSAIIPRIRLVLTDAAIDQRGLKLEVFFHGDDVSRPKSYLSDSQLNSLALGLRLVAIKKFNENFRFVVLDDVVTSYDADHRTTMAKAILEILDGFSFILLTHDERFFAIVRERSTVVDAIQIMRWSLEGGPQRTVYRGLYERIDNALAGGENPGNLIRHAEEDWLRQIGVQFGIYVPLLPAARAHYHERAKLAEGMIRRLRELKIKIPDTRTVRSRFLIAIKDGTVENFSSHFQTDPASIDSLGDQAARWGEFSALRKLFECSTHGCKSGRWQVVNDRHVMCTKCGQPLNMAARATSLWP